MGIIYSNDFITSLTITPRSENSSYPAENIEEQWHLPRLFKAEDATANDYLMVIDMASAKTVAAVFLNHVNFTSVTIQGHASDSWGSPSFTTTVTISEDDVVDRYKAFIPLTSFNYRYMRIFIPSGQTPTSDSVWFVGGLEVLDSYTELTRNPGRLTRTSELPIETNEIHGRTTDVMELGTLRGWSGSLKFSARKMSNEAELWTLNNLSPATPIVLYENLSDTSRVYLARKASCYQGAIRPGLIVDGNSIDFEEVGV